MLCGVPANAINAAVFEVLHKRFGAGLHLGVFRVDVAVVAELTMGDGVSAAIVDAAFPAYAAVRVPPGGVVSGGFVDVVGDDVHDDFYAVGMSLGAEAGQLRLGAVAVGFEGDIIGHVGVKPLGVGRAVALHGRYLHCAEAGGGDIGQFCLDVGKGPVIAMQDVALLDTGGNAIVVGAHRKCCLQHQRCSEDLS